MSATGKDHFAEKARDYESNEKRVANVDNIANSIINAIAFTADMEIVDFGSGTGLLLERVAPHVKKITAIDISRAMNEQLQAKLDQLDCKVEMKEIDLEQETIADSYDGIISSMTMHHIQDIGGMFEKFHRMVKPGGFIAIADLDSEDGSFHSEQDTGVYHFGFDRDTFAEQAVRAGFNNVSVSTASILSKPQGEYPIFLLTGTR
jgi:2-polyprenyl-3-methyl-5-hydroxy-6-metoxy-1,4-benzoquinol methylase